MTEQPCHTGPAAHVCGACAAVREWCDLADERGDGRLHTSTVRSVIDAAVYEQQREAE